MARNLKALVTKHSFKDRFKTAQTYLQKLKFLIEDVSPLPEYFLFILLFCNNNFTSKLVPTNVLKLLFDNVFQPQHSLPDVFIWVISNGKRTAYQRIPARDLIYSIVDEESGRHCGKVFTLFLKVFNTMKGTKTNTKVVSKLSSSCTKQHEKFFVS